MTRAEGFPCQGQLLSGEPVTGLLILRYERQQVDGFPHPVGAGMSRWCELQIEGPVPAPPMPFTAVVISHRLGERMQIDVTPEIVTSPEGRLQVRLLLIPGAQNSGGVRASGRVRPRLCSEVPQFGAAHMAQGRVPAGDVLYGVRLVHGARYRHEDPVPHTGNEGQRLAAANQVMQSVPTVSERNPDSRGVQGGRCSAVRLTHQQFKVRACPVNGAVIGGALPGNVLGPARRRRRACSTRLRFRRGRAGPCGAEV